MHLGKARARNDIGQASMLGDSNTKIIPPCAKHQLDDEHSHITFHTYVPAGCKKFRPIWRFTCSGINRLTSSGEAPDNCHKNRESGKQFVTKYTSNWIVAEHLPNQRTKNSSMFLLRELRVALQKSWVVCDQINKAIATHQQVLKEDSIFSKIWHAKVKVLIICVLVLSHWKIHSYHSGYNH